MDQTGNDQIVSAPSVTSLWTKIGLTTASVAAVGAVFGAFFLGTVFSNAPREMKPVASTETTGSAPAQDKARQDNASAPASVEAADAANCREQTWPYIARPCLSNEQGSRGVRVISTDKLADPVIGVVEAPPETVINRKTAPPREQMASPAPVATNKPATVDAPTLKSGASLGAVAIGPAAAAPDPEAVVATTVLPNDAPVAPVSATPANPTQPVVQASVAPDPQAMPEKKSSRDVEKAKRKAAKRQDRDSERAKMAVAESDDDEEPAAATRSGRTKGRIVERWTERDYTVSAHDGNGSRRVTVTSRDRDDVYRERAVSTERGGGFPNIFGAIFGN